MPLGIGFKKDKLSLWRQQQCERERLSRSQNVVVSSVGGRKTSAQILVGAIERLDRRIGLEWSLDRGVF